MPSKILLVAITIPAVLGNLADRLTMLEQKLEVMERSARRVEQADAQPACGTPKGIAALASFVDKMKGETPNQIYNLYQQITTICHDGAKAGDGTPIKDKCDVCAPSDSCDECESVTACAQGICDWYCGGEAHIVGAPNPPASGPDSYGQFCAGVTDGGGAP